MRSTCQELPPIVCLAGIDWDSLWQRSQIFMSGFADRGARVAYVEQLDAGRPITWSDWPRIVARGRNLLRGASAGPTGGNPRRRVKVVTPAILPFPAAGPLNRLLLRRLASRLEREGFESPLVWIQPFGGPNTPALERALSPSMVVYDCATRLRGYKYATPAMLEAEEALARRADLVFTDARVLWEEKRLLNPNCVQIPPGVDFDAFAPRADRKEPGPLRALSRPRLVFFGAINDRVDQEALVCFANSHPAWAVVLVGPAMTDLSVLRGAPNVFVFPALAHAELGAWLQAMDVIAIPYKSTEFTRGIIPAKLFESLATGKPVVASGLPELEPYAHVLSLCEAGGFGSAVEEVLASDSAARREERLVLARENSWASRVDRTYGLLTEAWNAKRAGNS